MGWKKVDIINEKPKTSLMTMVGLVEGDILTYLEENGPTALGQVVQDLEWPSRLVMMAAGSLIRRGLVRAAQDDLAIVLELREIETQPNEGKES
ncbi:MAG: hypothetical protein ABH845_01580 [Candidatus Omnitrophota bacterium]